jgi:hypothetical protein
MVGPSLIGGRQKTTISLLVDGTEPLISCPGSPLVDVKLLKGVPPAFAESPRVRIPFLMASFPVLLIILLWSLKLVAKDSSISWPIILTLAASMGAGYVLFSLVSSASESLGLFRKFPMGIRRDIVSFSGTAGVFLGMILAFLAFISNTPPYYGQNVDTYLVSFPVGANVPFRPEKFLPSLGAAVITFSHNRIESSSMLLGTLSLSDPTFAECAGSGEAGNKAIATIPPDNQNVCAVGLDVAIAMRILSANSQAVTLHITVWDNQSS